MLESVGIRFLHVSSTQGPVNKTIVPNLHTILHVNAGGGRRTDERDGRTEEHDDGRTEDRTEVEDDDDGTDDGRRTDGNDHTHSKVLP